MSNETDTVSKVERLRQTQQTEAAKAMDRAEGVLALLHEIRDAVIAVNPREPMTPGAAMTQAEIREVLNQVVIQLKEIQKSLPRAKLWRWLLERLEGLQSMQEEARRSVYALIPMIILAALGTSLLTAFFTGQITRSILRELLLSLSGQ
ncbi:MAG: hypothetical protein LHW45_10605 [Candidatus Cloacimonetes bacterium]|jgi:hypothetical protein|nr:hypothetical protein [Candidatus Cloacimonadota bacterium]MDY0368059.1 hypothetical protein [Candidatus Syntrophosphaera sp.]